ncbi:MAG: hypothetical protein BBJ60_10570 [Desulfobacterales bacterium S7086C20]|nr:MAG: hypothetical protein BBJ60_10570 [Desulfobacterales bacterium S7086C20]
MSEINRGFFIITPTYRYISKSAGAKRGEGVFFKRRHQSNPGNVAGYFVIGQARAKLIRTFGAITISDHCESPK